jgi:hypothetical protein
MHVSRRDVHQGVKPGLTHCSGARAASWTWSTLLLLRKCPASSSCTRTLRLGQESQAGARVSQLSARCARRSRAAPKRAHVDDALKLLAFTLAMAVTLQLACAVAHRKVARKQTPSKPSKPLHYAISRLHALHVSLPTRHRAIMRQQMRQKAGRGCHQQKPQAFPASALHRSLPMRNSVVYPRERAHR